MDGGRYRDPVNDASLDREIESMMEVEPSPEFLARVRTRVAKEPEPSRWRSSWTLAIAGGVTVVIVALIAWPSREPASSSGEPVRGLRTGAVETLTPLASSTAPQPVRRQPARARASAVAASPDRAIEIDLPEVVIAENEAKTFAALVASIRQSRFDAVVPAAPNPDTPLEIKELLPVEPLEIEPIVKVAALQAEGERP